MKLSEIYDIPFNEYTQGNPNYNEQLNLLTRETRNSGDVPNIGINMDRLITVSNKQYDKELPGYIKDTSGPEFKLTPGLYEILYTVKAYKTDHSYIRFRAIDDTNYFMRELGNGHSYSGTTSGVDVPIIIRGILKVTDYLATGFTIPSSNILPQGETYFSVNQSIMEEEPNGYSYGIPAGNAPGIGLTYEEYGYGVIRRIDETIPERPIEIIESPVHHNITSNGVMTGEISGLAYFYYGDQRIAGVGEGWCLSENDKQPIVLTQKLVKNGFADWTQGSLGGLYLAGRTTSPWYSANVYLIGGPTVPTDIAAVAYGYDIGGALPSGYTRYRWVGFICQPNMNVNSCINRDYTTLMIGKGEKDNPTLTNVSNGTWSSSLEDMSPWVPAGRTNEILIYMVDSVYRILWQVATGVHGNALHKGVSNAGVSILPNGCNSCWVPLSKNNTFSYLGSVDTIYVPQIKIKR